MSAPETEQGSPVERPVALIISGGKAMRMRRLGEYFPKCLLAAFDQPLLVRQVETCRQAGIEDVFVSVGERHGNLIQSMVGRAATSANVHFVVDDRQLGPVPAFRTLLKLSEGRPSFLWLGDIYLENDTFFRALNPISSACVTLQAQPQPDRELIRSGCNIVLGAAEEVLDIREKPASEEISGDLCWTGVAYHPASFLECLEKLPDAESRSCRHLGDLYRALLLQGRPVSILRESGAVLNVTSPEDALLMSLMEFRRICRVRPGDKQRDWHRLQEILGDPRVP